MGAKGSSVSARCTNFFVSRVVKPASSSPSRTRFLQKREGASRSIARGANVGAREGSWKRGRSRTNDVGHGAARLGGRGEVRAGSFPCSPRGAWRRRRAMFEPAILPGRRELQYSCDLCGELPISCKRWCCDVCEDFGTRVNPVDRARIPLPRADPTNQRNY